MKLDRILITTPYCSEYYDYYKENCLPGVPRLSYPRVNSYGLSFLKQNIPDIEILEYPTQEEYRSILQKEKWNVIGYSFFTSDYNRVLQMLNQHHDNKIETWAGGYGALIPECNEKFTRVFKGYSEHNLQVLLRLDIKKLIHPPIIDFVGDTESYTYSKIGILFTTRGCLFNSLLPSPLRQHRVPLQHLAPFLPPSGFHRDV